MPSARFGATESITRALAAGRPPHVLVRTTTGLEPIAAAQLRATGHEVLDLSPRQLVAVPASAAVLTAPPRVADDLFLVAASCADPGPRKSDLVQLGRRLAPTFALPLDQPAGTTIAVSASWSGRRAYSRYDVEDLVGAWLAARTGSTYHSRRAGRRPPDRRTDWRVVLDGAGVHLAVRPYAVPLHRRPWRTRTVVGSLHPPVAAAMAHLAELRPGHEVLDPCCGAGTLLIEARDVQPEASYLGTDRSAAAVAAARHNGGALPQLHWSVRDVRDLPSRVAPVDRILTNPPWGVRLSDTGFRGLVHAWRRLLRPDGRLVAVMPAHQAAALAADPRWVVRDSLTTSVAGQRVVIVVAEPAAPRRHGRRGQPS